MCNKCYGRGTTVEETFAGVWHIKPCSCGVKKSDERMKRVKRRLAEAYERFGEGEMGS